MYRSGQRVKKTMASAISIEGKLFFQTFDGSTTGPRYKEFLNSLNRTSRKPKFIIHDGLPSHRARIVTEYVESTNGQLRIFQLPGYSPELNPDELVWENLKKHLGKRAHKSIEEMREKAVSYLNSLKRDKKTVSNFVDSTYGHILQYG